MLIRDKAWMIHSLPPLNPVAGAHRCQIVPWITWETVVWRVAPVWSGAPGIQPWLCCKRLKHSPFPFFRRTKIHVTSNKYMYIILTSILFMFYYIYMIYIYICMYMIYIYMYVCMYMIYIYICIYDIYIIYMIYIWYIYMIYIYDIYMIYIYDIWYIYMIYIWYIYIYDIHIYNIYMIYIYIWYINNTICTDYKITCSCPWHLSLVSLALSARQQSIGPWRCGCCSLHPSWRGGRTIRTAWGNGDPKLAGWFHGTSYEEMDD